MSKLVSAAVFEHPLLPLLKAFTYVFAESWWFRGDRAW
jgi:hypothetical protein